MERVPIRLGSESSSGPAVALGAGFHGDAWLRWTRRHLQPLESLLYPESCPLSGGSQSRSSFASSSRKRHLIPLLALVAEDQRNRR